MKSGVYGTPCVSQPLLNKIVTFAQLSAFEPVDPTRDYGPSKVSLSALK